MQTFFLKGRIRQNKDFVRKKKKNTLSPAGNRTPVSRVTGGDTHHYTTEDETLEVVLLKYLEVLPR